MPEESRLVLADIMTRDVITVRPDDPLQEVAKLMSTHHVSGFPVIWSDGQVVGVITEGDFLRRYRTLRVPTFVDILGGLFPLTSLAAVEREIREISSIKVSEIMSRPAVTARPDWTVGQAADVMIQHGINRLPVADSSGHLVGIVTRADLIKAMERPA